jgi:hypothetical protein
MPQPLRHFQTLGLLALALAVATGAPGCQASSTSTVSAQGVNITVVHPVGSPTNSSSASNNINGNETSKMTISWGGEKPGEVVILLENLRLQIDGRDYGKLKSGDSLTIDVLKERKVTVNHQVREPVAK